MLDDDREVSLVLRQCFHCGGERLEYESEELSSYM